MTEEWVCKRKGTAKIYTHPLATEGRAVVKNHLGISFNGEKFPTLDAAKQAALLTLDNPNQTD